MTLPTPKRWPATYKDFYHLIVRGKDEGTNQHRVKGWLRDERLPVHPVYGRRVDHGLPPLTELEKTDAVDAIFAEWKAQPIPDLKAWNFLAYGAGVGGYLRWWAIQKAEAKRRGGKAAATKAKARAAVSI